LDLFVNAFGKREHYALGGLKAWLRKPFVFCSNGILSFFKKEP